jgi:hypothetical protein
MAVKLHRCRLSGCGPGRVGGKALKEMGVDYELAPGPSGPSKRDEMIEHTGPEVLSGDRTRGRNVVRDESRDMEVTIRDGGLLERRGGALSS